MQDRKGGDAAYLEEHAQDASYTGIHIRPSAERNIREGRDRCTSGTFEKPLYQFYHVKKR